MHLLSQQITFIWCKDEWRTELEWFTGSYLKFFFSLQVCLCHVNRAAFTESVCRSWPRATRSTVKVPLAVTFLLLGFLNCPMCLCISRVWEWESKWLFLFAARPLVCPAVHVMLRTMFHTTESTCSTAPPASSQQWESSGFDTNIPEEIHVWTKRDIPELLDSVFYNVFQKK